VCSACVHPQRRLQSGMLSHLPSGVHLAATPAKVALPLLAVAVCAACADDVPAPPGPAAVPPSGAIVGMTFNVAGAATTADPVAGPTMAMQIEGSGADVVMLQECTGCPAFLSLLPDRYGLVHDEGSEVAIAYDDDRWRPIADGSIVLGENDDGWGRREARWVRLVERDGDGMFDVYSTHWCVTIRRDDDPCTPERHVDYARQIVDDLAARVSRFALVGGDLNVFDGFEDSLAVRYLEAQGLVDVFREVSDEDGITFQGNSWAPPGRIDYVFSTSPVDVHDATVDTSHPAPGGSDHYPVIVTVSFE
jgi:endonuclease/exonuclease/phosphatase family metal-dependent hydrolase